MPIQKATKSDLGIELNIDPFKYMETVKKELIEQTKRIEISGKVILEDPSVPETLKQWVRHEINDQRELLKVFME